VDRRKALRWIVASTGGLGGSLAWPVSGAAAPLAPRELLDPFENLDGGPDATATGLDGLTFQNTMTWGSGIALRAVRALRSSSGWQDGVALSRPPANSSKRTASELRLLRAYKRLRTPETIRQIEREVDSHNVVIGERALAAYLSSRAQPATSELLGTAMAEILEVVLGLKLKFDGSVRTSWRPTSRRSSRRPDTRRTPVATRPRRTFWPSCCRSCVPNGERRCWRRPARWPSAGRSPAFTTPATRPPGIGSLNNFSFI
jgi:hypothetical protein